MAPIVTPHAAIMPLSGAPKARAPRALTIFAAYALLGAAIVLATITVRSLRSRALHPVQATPAPVVIAPSLTIPGACPAGMVAVPGGRFLMGNDAASPAERPAHVVSLSPYCIDVNEVTTADYRSCGDEGACKRAGASNEWRGVTDADHRSLDGACNARDPVGRAAHPINCIDWDMAARFCATRGKRLPTEAEWELAARGDDARAYPWGNDEPAPELLNACGHECSDWARRNRVDTWPMYSGDDGWATTAPVGSYPRGASPYGLNDTAGNVWEWVADWYGPYASAEATAPIGPPTGTTRVLRGGAWNGAYPAWVRTTFRYDDAPDKRSAAIGFRCASSQ
jgi:formylglycine-generating enzyme required for sulfatase activity